MRYSLLLTLLLFVLISSSNAQTTIQGAVLDGKDKLPLPMAQVILVSLPDSSLTTTSTDLKGLFLFNTISPGSYLLRASYIGYEETEIKIEAGFGPIHVGEILMMQENILLKELTIVDKIPPATQLGDTTQLNAAAFKTSPDASAEDLVQKMPGITLQDGRVQAQGENVQRVLVDGKPYFGDDPNAVLRNLPAEVIDKIQIFDEQSEQARFSGFDDGNTSKTINIITKPGMRNGTFGKLYAGYGYDNVFSAGGSVNILKDSRRISILGQTNNINRQNFSSEDLRGISSSRGGGGRGGGGRNNSISDFLVNQRNGINTTHAIGINYTDKWRDKVDVTGSYFFNLGNNDARTTSLRTYVLADDTGRVYSETSFANSRNINHRFNARIDYQIDSLNSVLIQPRLSVQQNNGSSINTGQNNLGALLQNESINDFISALTGINFSNEILYRRRLDKAGRTFSLELNTGFNSYTGENQLLAETNYYTDIAFSDTLNQRSDMDRKGWSAGVSTIYTEPAGKKGQMQFRYNNNFTFNNSDKHTLRFNEETDLYDQADSTLSNRFRNRYVTQHVSSQYRYSGEKLNFMLGIGYQWSQLDNEQLFPFMGEVQRTFHNVLPRANLRYNFSKSKNLRLFYRSRTNAPDTDELQEVIDNSNPVQLRTGNSGLNEDYSHIITLRYSAANVEKSSSFFALLSSTFTRNYIGRSSYFAGTDTILAGIFLPGGTQLIRPENLSGYVSLRSFVNYGIPLAFMKSNFNMNTSFSYARTPGIINGADNQAHTPSISAGVVISSNIKPEIDFTLSSNSGVNWVKNTLNTNSDTRYYSQQSRARFNWIFWKGLFVNTELSHQYYSGLSSDLEQNYLLLHLSAGASFLKNRVAEIRFSAFDVLDQNKSFQRISNDAWYEDVSSNTLGRHFMLTFTYNLKRYKQG